MAPPSGTLTAASDVPGKPPSMDGAGPCGAERYDNGPASVLGPDGPFAHHLCGFTPRSAQQEMAEAVAQALADYGVLIAEAGTGTGKTFAYLVPAVLCGGRVIVSTGTRNLQDQLFYRDLPTVQRALGVQLSTALLKGRGNYLCLHRLTLYGQRARAPEHAALFTRLSAWAEHSDTGDIAELADIPEGATVWSQVTATVDSCLGQDCQSLSRCFFFKARRQAQEAELLVINHHLLCADVALRGEAVGELLPEANAVIVDEAHQLPEVAAQFLGTSLSSGQLLELARDTVAEHLREAGDMPVLVDSAARLETATQAVQAMLGEPRRAAWREVADESRMRAALDALWRTLEQLGQQLEYAAVRGKGLEHCWQRSQTVTARLAALLAQGDDRTVSTEANDYVQWLDIRGRAFTVHSTPLDVSGAFRERIHAHRCAWVFASATLAVDGRFTHFTARLGLERAHAIRWESPFDFARQALLYVPRELPDPNASGYHEAVILATLPVLLWSRGRAFLLFTSHKALLECARGLEGRTEYPLLVQGQAPRSVLLERFRRMGNAVLLGTSSFWEGVDVRGDALSLVVIDRLPFASPGDPVLHARVERLREQGADPFMDYQLPNAVIALKQGVGRLIRDSRDRGVLMLCDPRLLTRPYSRIFLDSLPAMPVTREPDEVRRFFDTPAPQPQGL